MSNRKSIKIIFMMLIILLMGCGNPDDNTDVQKNDDTSFKMQIDTSTIINRNRDSEIDEDSVERLDESIIEEAVKFSCKDEIKAASSDSGLVQIDDMILQYGDKFSEIASVVEQSECVYEADYNALSVVPAGESVGIRFNKNGELYFMICVENREKETVELKDCITYSIRASYGSMGNAYYAGFSDSDMTYSTVKDAMKGYEPEKEIFGLDARSNKKLGIMYAVPFQEEKMYIYFIFDSITNELTNFEITEKKFDDTVFWSW